MAAEIDITLPSYTTDVRHAPALAGPASAGLVIAVTGAFVPARRAARLTVAEVLRSEW
jgi:putative ABC transport system permease protein